MKSVFNGDGITLAEDWFCGPECLEFALRLRFAEVIRQLKPVEAPRPARVPMGLMLFQRGSMNEEQFKAALEEHRASGARIGDVALQLGFVSEEQVAAALDRAMGIPRVPDERRVAARDFANSNALDANAPDDSHPVAGRLPQTAAWFRDPCRSRGNAGGRESSRVRGRALLHHPHRLSRRRSTCLSPGRRNR